MVGISEEKVKEALVGEEIPAVVREALAELEQVRYICLSLTLGSLIGHTGRNPVPDLSGTGPESAHERRPCRRCGSRAGHAQ